MMTKFVSFKMIGKIQIRRHKFRDVQRKLVKNKKVYAIRRFNDKEHKISREIINFVIVHHISIIRLKQLTNRRQQEQVVKEKNLHTGPFYRLLQCSTYKGT